jgi:pyruvate formate lyase activating enzyme
MLCHAACKTGANISCETGIAIDDALCVRCGDCVKACPAKAMTFIGEEWTLENLIKEVMRDKVYYDKTGGGVTVSGGECMMQHHFIAEFFRQLQDLGVDTAIDTCGLVSYSAFEEVLPYTNHVLYDLKLWDNGLHKKYTKQDNELTLANVRRMANAIAQGSISADLWIRTPLIPGVTATMENITAIGSFIAKELNGAVSRWELCSFNNSCITKYQRLNLPWAYHDTTLIDHETSEALRRVAMASGVNEELIVVTGLISE